MSQTITLINYFSLIYSVFYRVFLLFFFQDVIEKSHLSGDYFTSFLHQNYMDFFSNLSDVVRASEYISDADFFTSEWEVCMTGLKFINK